MDERWVVFDVMGVIFEVADDVRDLLVPYVQSRYPQVAASLIHETYLEASLGKISAREFWGRLGLGADYPAIENHYLDHQLTLDQTFVGVAEQLARRYRLAILSNDIAEWAAYLRGRHNLNRLFSAVVVSGEAGLRKPDPRIYELLLARLGARAEQCVFIDDRSPNLAAAAERGLKTIQFVRPEAGEAQGPSARVSGFEALLWAVPRQWA